VVGIQLTKWIRQGALTISGGNTLSGEVTVLYEGTPSVLTGETSVFKMWYGQCDPGPINPTIRYAESTDGINWTTLGTILSILPDGISRTSVFRYNSSTMYLYGSRNDTNLERWHSTTGGTSWVSDGIVLIPDGSGWNSIRYVNNYVWIEETTWHMLIEAEGANWKIGHLTSTDGTVWSEGTNNPVLSENQANGGPFLHILNNVYYCWLHQSTVSNLPTDIRAYSSTLLDQGWTHRTDLDVDLPRVGDDEGETLSTGQTADGCLLEVNGTVYLWYTGMRYGDTGSDSHIKLATYSGSWAQLLEEYAIDTLSTSLSPVIRTGSDYVIFRLDWYDPSDLDATAYTVTFWARDNLGNTIGPYTAQTYTKSTTSTYYAQYTFDPSDTINLGLYDLKAEVYKDVDS
jgi:hypothetical protein